MFLSSFHLISLSFLVIKSLVTATTVNSEHHVVEELSSVPEGWVQGRVPSPDTPIHLRLAVYQEKSHIFERMVLDISTPGHARYGQFMTRADVKEFFQPPGHVSESILAWLRDSGIPEASIKNDGDWIHFTVSVSKAEKMLQTRFYHFNELDNRDISMIHTTRYSVPTEIAPHVHMIQPTTRFGIPKRHTDTIFEPQDPVAPGNQDVDCNKTITPECLRQLYKIGDFLAMPDSRNVIGISGYLEQFARYADFEKFLRLFAPNLVGTNFTVQSINSGLNLQNSTEDSGEASLDIDYAISLSNATAIYYTTAGRGPLVSDLDQPDTSHNTNEPYLDQLHYLMSLPDDELPAVLTTSYGENEQSVPKKFSDATCSLFSQLGARGMSIIFSSGDSGVGTSCQTNTENRTTRFNPIFPAACPSVTSVGSTVNTKPERAIRFSSGGFSERYPRPQYQEEAVSAYLEELGDKWKGLYNPEGRGFPDVSAQGHDFQVFDKGVVKRMSGTSASAPVFAAIIANLNSIRLGQGKPVLGPLNPFLYGIGRRGFTDIVHGGSTGCHGHSFGNATWPHVPYASWNATKGWDPVSGLGTPNFETLAKLVATLK